MGVEGIGVWVWALVCLQAVDRNLDVKGCLSRHTTVLYTCWGGSGKYKFTKSNFIGIVRARSRNNPSTCYQ